MDAAPAAIDFRAIGVIDPDPVPLERIAGFGDDDIADAWTSFLLSCRRIVDEEPALRPGVPADAALVAVCRDALALGAADQTRILAFIGRRFRAWRVRPSEGAARGFLTGYYEPVVPGAWTKSEAFAAPLLARPADLVTLRPGDDWGDLDKRLSGAARGPDGALRPYASRAEIDTRRERYRPLVFVRDAIEAFMIHIQGSAAISIDGELVRLTYAGRNGRPYTSIGRILIERGDIPRADMSLARLKQWVRDHGQKVGEAGRDLLWRNESFVFFDVDRSPDRAIGPIGAAGTPLRPLRSIAVDRSIWPYGLLFWIESELPWKGPDATPFRRLMVAQDTGSAIVGSARADLYMGAGDAAGAIAGDIRHPADFIVLLPEPSR